MVEASEGIIGFITSDTWQDVGFGEGLRIFFLNHCSFFLRY
jgi:hypothetical protein